MNGRQAFAIAHPLQGELDMMPGGRLEQCRRVRLRGDGTLLSVILAVDR